MGTFPNKEKQFKKGQSGNPKGRPRLMVSQVIKDLEEKGIEGVSPSQVVGLYERLLNTTIMELTELANNEGAGWEIRQTAKYMLKNPEKAWNDIHDRAHGKAVQKQQTEHSGSIDTTSDELKGIANDLKSILNARS